MIEVTKTSYKNYPYSVRNIITDGKKIYYSVGIFCRNEEEISKFTHRDNTYVINGGFYFVPSGFLPDGNTRPYDQVRVIDILSDKFVRVYNMVSGKEMVTVIYALYENQPITKTGRLIPYHNSNPRPHYECIDCHQIYPVIDGDIRCNGYIINLCPWCRSDSARWAYGRGI